MITVKSYDGKMVRIPEEKKEEYERCQELIRQYLKEGKTEEEIKELLKNEWRNQTNNNQFGIRTEFITGESTLGYALGNTIYINTSINQDYEKTNKHELLHFFEGTPEFEKVKKDILEKNAEELPNIRKEYELRYWGIYSKEEINAGVLDNEIVIDIMTDNSSIVYEEGLKVGDIFLGEVQQKLAEKRYLNLSLTGNIKNMKLSEWEKIFVLNYYDGKDKILPQGKDRVEKIREDIEKYLNELSKLDKTTMQIDPYSPEVIREYESEIKALKARGEDTTRLEENPEMGYKKIAEETSKQLYEEYKQYSGFNKWIRYGTSI